MSGVKSQLIPLVKKLEIKNLTRQQRSQRSMKQFFTSLNTHNGSIDRSVAKAGVFSSFVSAAVFCLPTIVCQKLINFSLLQE